MIQEGIVLFRIQHLEESAGRITVDSSTDFVDFIDQNQWVLSANALESLDDLSRKSSVGHLSNEISMIDSRAIRTRHMFSDVL